jgi:hypothetical protein
MWAAIQHVTTGLALVAFLGALGFLAYRTALRNRLKIINTVPRQRRADVITKELNAFGIDAKNLSTAQQYELAKREIELRSRRSSLRAILAVVVMLIFGGVAVVAIRAPEAPESPTGAAGDVIQEYGERPDALYMSVNSHLLLTYQDKFKMMFIANVLYADIDIMTDTAIDKSALYTITGSLTVLAIASPSHLRVVPPPGSSETFKINTSFSLVVIPNNVSPEQVRSLSDVTRVGGKIIESRGRDVEFRRLAPARQ